MSHLHAFGMKRKVFLKSSSFFNKNVRKYFLYNHTTFLHMYKYIQYIQKNIVYIYASELNHLRALWKIFEHTQFWKPQFHQGIPIYKPTTASNTDFLPLITHSVKIIGPLENLLIFLKFLRYIHKTTQHTCQTLKSFCLVINDTKLALLISTYIFV